MRNNNFDLLRFCFAFIVLLVHLAILSGRPELQIILNHLSSYISVMAFFIISGYLITKSYESSSSIKSYFKKRAARLLPAYVLVVVLCALGFVLISDLNFVDYFSHKDFYKYLFANIAFQNYLQPGLPGVFNNLTVTNDVNGALWTLKIEVAFYLTLPLVILISKKLRNSLVFFILIYLLSISYKIGFEFLGAKTGNNILLYLSRQLPGFYCYFVSGILVYKYKEVFTKNKFIYFLIGLLVFVLERNNGIEFLTPIALSAIVFFIAFSFPVLNNFAKYGDFSYGIYIYHFPIINLLVSMGLFNILNPYAASAITIIIIGVISILSWHFLENPFLNKVRQK